MDKPTIFFSHSSKDKQTIMRIKNKLNIITSETLDIFMSSDGQSIPFGKNWVHKIEEGLAKAKIMFVFVTPNSIRSDWIYFEAGFAYSKGINVIPVGLGVDISSIRAPLSLLQGFNITSSEGLNNITATINKEFSNTFSVKFTDEDFRLFIPNEELESIIDIGKYFDSAKFGQESEFTNSKNIDIKYDNQAFFNNIIKYLQDNSISYSLQEPYNGRNARCLLVKGIKIVLTIGIPKNDRGIPTEVKIDTIEFKISTYNLSNSFPVYIKLLELLEGREWFHLVLKPNEKYSLVLQDEKISALLLKYPDIFIQSNDLVGQYMYRKSNLLFKPIDSSFAPGPDKSSSSLWVNFECKTITAYDFIQLLSSLIETKVLYEKE